MRICNGCIITPPVTAEADIGVLFMHNEGFSTMCGHGIIEKGMAIHHARVEIGLNQPIVIESIIGSRFSGKVVQTTTFGSYPAIIPEIEGTAHITGRHEFLIDPLTRCGKDLFFAKKRQSTDNH